MDDYPSYNVADPRGLRVENLLASLKNMHVAYFFGKINSSTDKMIEEFRKVAKNEKFVREADLKDPGNIFAMALQSVSITIDAKITSTLAGYT